MEDEYQRASKEGGLGHLNLNPQLVEDVKRMQKSIRVSLAPWISGVRYSSYGRHFTQNYKLKEIAERIRYFLRHEDCVVDFGCGANEWLPAMKQAMDGFGLRGTSFRAFDIATPSNDWCFSNRDYYTVKPSELPHKDRLVIGLNPPFGVDCKWANEFVRRAAEEFEARLICLIVPPATQMPIRGYRVLEFNRTLLEGKVFYYPGSINIAEGERVANHNNVPPAFIILQRMDACEMQDGMLMEKGTTWERVSIS